MATFYFTNDSYELQHHGILGMKWGVKNGPPYPLDASSHSKREKKAGWRKSLNSGNTESKDNKKRKFTFDKKKALKVGLAVALAYGTYKIATSGTSNSIGKIITENLIEGNNESGSISEKVLSTINRYKNDSFKDAKGIFDYNQIKRLSDNEIRAIQAYTTPLYKEVNDVLRNGGEGTSFGKQIAKEMTNALKKVTLSSDANLQRGIDKNDILRKIGKDNYAILKSIAAQYGKNSDEFSIDLLKKVEINDKGICSTAVPFTNPNGKKTSIANKFSGSEGVVLELLAKSGTHGMYISPISEQQSEREVIIAPNSTIILNGTVKIIDGIIHLYGTINA